MSTAIDVLQRFFAAINRNDIRAASQDFDAAIVRVEPAGFPTSGTYRGIAEVQAHLVKGRGSWAEGSCDPESYLVQGDRVVVYLHARVRLHGSNEWIDGRFADGFVVRDGRIIEYLTFGERSDALAWAGIASDHGRVTPGQATL